MGTERQKHKHYSSQEINKLLAAYEHREFTEANLPKSLLGMALQYALRQGKYLLAFLQDGRIELSYNRAERARDTLIKSNLSYGIIEIYETRREWRCSKHSAIWNMETGNGKPNGKNIWILWKRSYRGQNGKPL